MKNFKRLLLVLDKWKGFYLFSALLMIGSVIFRMLEPKVLQIAIDGVIAFYQSSKEALPTLEDPVARYLFSWLPEMTMDNMTSLLMGVAVLYMVIALGRGFSMFSSSAIKAYCTEKAIKRLRDNLFSHLQRLPLSYHSKNTTGEIIQRCTGDVDTIKEFIGSQIVDFIMLVAMFVTAFLMMASVHLPYALIAVASFPIITITAYFFFRWEKTVWEEHEARQDKLTALVEENLGGIRVVKAFAKEDFEIEKFEKLNQDKKAIGLKHVDLHAFFWTSSDLLVWTQMSVSVFAGGYFALHNQISLGELASFYTYAFMVTMPMRRLAQVVSRVGMAFVALDRISNILDEKTEDYEGKEIEVTELKGEVEFQHVSFRYNDDDGYALENVSFKVKAGEQVALLGATGAGKSTLIALLARFYEPTSGTILIDGKPINSYSKSFLRSKIGIVLQKAFLFSTTIGGNIAYTKPGISQEEIIEVAKAASIHEIMHIFPEGYDTMVGEKGVTLSGGQKQRVALARTLLEKPDILVLDDATSAVDTETEQHIQAALEQHMKNKTSFIIAHRISAVQHADLIVVLDKGKVVQAGAHEALLNEKGGFYQQVYQAQIAVEQQA